ncbi:MAG: hypothetical protein RIR26_2065 [Pseudomonadota bacterium]|jgi:hypothetical protein
MNQMNENEPWYAPAGKKKATPVTGALSASTDPSAPSFLNVLASLFWQLIRLRSIFFAFFLIAAAHWVGFRVLQSQSGAPSAVGFLVLALGFLLALLVLLQFLGQQLLLLLPLHKGDAPLQVAFSWMRGRLKREEGRRGPPAPELALAQFVSQVRSYASEKSFQNVKPNAERHGDTAASQSEAAPLLKRRWNEVVDSLDEFELYLANDPQGIIGKLVSKNPPKLLDAAVVFRDVAESFDTTWRRKGINIESAIVTPLKATAHEGLLRRLLVGPWRASAYFARRGASVVFSAKSVQGRVLARWEVDGLSIPEEYLEVANNSAIPVNERIEKGLQTLSPDPSNSPNTLYALISLVTWIDLAHACDSEFEFKNNNSGFVIELRLK